MSSSKITTASRFITSIALTLFSAFILLTQISFASDVILVVADANPDSQEASARSQELESLTKALPNIDSVPRVAVLRLKHLDELKAATEQAIGASDRVTGVVFVGHGNATKFGFSARETYNGTGVATLLGDALSTFPISQNFTVYFKACSTAACSASGKNFQDRFGDEFANILQTRTQKPQLQVISHLYDAAIVTEIRHLNPFAQLLSNSHLMTFIETVHSPLNIGSSSTRGILRTWPVFLGLLATYLYPSLGATPTLSATTFALTVLNIASLYLTSKSARLVTIRDGKDRTEVRKDVYSLAKQALRARCESVLTNSVASTGP